MGYYTDYSLHTDDGQYSVHERGIEGKYDFTHVLQDSSKWYEHDADMCEYSKLYPEVTFRLTGVGEEQFDIWRKWYKNGQIIGEWRFDEKSIPENP